MNILLSVLLVGLLVAVIASKLGNDDTTHHGGERGQGMLAFVLIIFVGVIIIGLALNMSGHAHIMTVDSIVQSVGKWISQ